MAEKNPLQHLCDEATCPICLEYFKEPVLGDCGHVFCQACISQCCGQGGKEAACPQCREPIQQSSFRPVRPLTNIVEIAKQFCLQMARGAEALGSVCQKHQEPLKLFCRSDLAPICVVCDKSRGHSQHQVIPKEEAFEEYKGKIQSHLKFLKEEKNAVLSSKDLGEMESQSLLEKTEAQRQKIVAEFKQLHEFLEEREHLLLAQLKDLDDEVNDHREKRLAKLLEKLSSLDNLIKEMEEKQEQPVDEFLQDLKNTLERCPKEKFVSPEAFPKDLKERIEKFSEMHPFLNTAVKTFKDTVISGPPEKKVLPPNPGRAFFPNPGHAHYQNFWGGSSGYM